MKMMKTLKRLLAFAKPYRRFIWSALLSAVVSVSMTLLGPVLVGDAIDQMIGAGAVRFDAIARLVAGLLVSVALGALFQWFMALCTNKLTYWTVRDLRTVTFRKFHTVPLKYTDTHAHGDVMSRMVNDIDLVADGLLQGLTQLFTGVVTIAGTLIFMLTINAFIAFVVVLVTPLSLFVASFIARGSHRMFREQSKTQGEVSGFVEELVGNQKVVKAFCHEPEAEAQFEEINQRLYRCGVKAQFYSALANPCTRFVNGIVYAAVGIIGAVSVVGGHLSVGQLSCFLSYANQYTKPFNEVTGVITQLQTAFASAARVFAVLDEADQSPDPADSREISHCRGEVEFEHVYFSYTPQRPLIKDFNLHVQAGQRIAIVGPTGCGKTTLINLLMRFYDVTGGSISIDGVPVVDMDRGELRSLFGMVLQDTWLFEGTIAENIGYSKKDATREEIIAAAKAAHAHGFIERMKDGYDTVITQSGGNISQGQKQLLCIARVMLAQSPMLILDEATSNIDTLTEIRIQRAFARLMKGRTSFVVAHRLSTIQEADQILVMRDGNIVEQGDHQTLLNKGGFYANLYESQFDRQS